MPLATVTVDPAELDTPEKLKLARQQIGEFARRNAGAPEVASFPADLDSADADALATALGVVLSFRQSRGFGANSLRFADDHPQTIARKFRALDSVGKGKIVALMATEFSRVVAANAGDGGKGGN